MILMSIDPGVNNGFAVYDKSKKDWLYTGELPLWDLFEKIKSYTSTEEQRIDCKIFIEDPRMISGGAGKALGAGWVRTLAGQYQRYCVERGLKYELIKPTALYTKKTETFVKLQTGLTTKEENHNERDAIMLIYFYGLH